MLIRRFLPEVMAFNKYILNKDIWVTAVIQVPPNVSLNSLCLKVKDGLNIKCHSITSVMASMM